MEKLLDRGMTNRREANLIIKCYQTLYHRGTLTQREEERVIEILEANDQG